MKRSKHSLSHYRLTSLNQGLLVPVMCEEALPGDSWRQQTSVLLRVSPLVAPVMHPVHMCLHSFFVPNRLVWDNWEAFITGRDTSKVVPTITIDPGLNPTNDNAHKLSQAFGVGVDTATYTVNALPFRGYTLIHNEFYRDQDLDGAAPVVTADSGDNIAAYFIRPVCWEKDYFTVCRPYPQQGANTEVVTLNITGDLKVKGIGVGTGAAFASANPSVRESDGVTRNYTNAQQAGTAAAPNTTYIEQGSAGFPNIRIPAGTSISGGMDINDFRRAYAMQRIREHRNKFGSRYTDMLRFLGVTPSDARLQRPEYLGGAKRTISFSEVLSTADTGTAAIGDMAGHGIGALQARPWKRFIEEHGYIFTFLFVRPQSVYNNRVPRHFLRRDYEQYWQKELEMMGEQAVTNFEVYGDSGTPSDTFGYTGRFDEYRHGESSVAGEFRSILDYWHMARKFSSQPVLNSSFVNCNPTDRIYASAVNDELYAMVGHRISARRLVSRRARA